MSELTEALRTHGQQHRGADLGGVLQPAPAPRFGRSQPAMPTPPVQAGAHSGAILAAAGFSADEVAAMRASGAVMGE